MKQFLLSKNYNINEEIVITGPDLHYLKNVRRQKNGNIFFGIDPDGKQYRLLIVKKEKSRIILRVMDKIKPCRKQIPVTLIQALPKGRKMDQIVRQATEAGINKIIPLLCRNIVTKFDKVDNIERKLQRWGKIAKEAVQQSGSCIYPVIEKPLCINNLIDKKIGGLKLVFHQERENNIALHSCLNEAVKEIHYLVGPEGGLEKDELKMLEDAGFLTVHLCETILRVETAALFALAAIKIILYENGSWRPK